MSHITFAELLVPNIRLVPHSERELNRTLPQAKDLEHGINKREAMEALTCLSIMPCVGGLRRSAGGFAKSKLHPGQLGQEILRGWLIPHLVDSSQCSRIESPTWH